MCVRGEGDLVVAVNSHGCCLDIWALLVCRNVSRNGTCWEPHRVLGCGGSVSVVGRVKPLNLHVPVYEVPGLVLVPHEWQQHSSDWMHSMLNVLVVQTRQLCLWVLPLPAGCEGLVAHDRDQANPFTHAYTHARTYTNTQCVEVCRGYWQHGWKLRQVT